MAYDKIIVIHSRLDRCLDYVQNDGKTDLGNAVDYICDPVKAGFQTAINCTPVSYTHLTLPTNREV